MPLDHKDLVFDISQFFALAGAQILQLPCLAPDLVAGGPDDAAGFVGEFLGGADLVVSAQADDALARWPGELSLSPEGLSWRLTS